MRRRSKRVPSQRTPAAVYFQSDQNSDVLLQEANNGSQQDDVVSISVEVSSDEEELSHGRAEIIQQAQERQADQQSQEVGRVQGGQLDDQRSQEVGRAQGEHLVEAARGGMGGEDAEDERVDWESRIDPEVPVGQAPDQIDMDGWVSIDRVGGWEAFLCEFQVMEYVPRQHSEVWAWAWAEVLKKIKGAEGKDLDRGLKWLCSLSQLLLRKPRRGGQTGRGNVAKRFNSLSVRKSWGALLKLWEKDVRLLREEERREKRKRQVGSEEEENDRRRRQVMALLGKGQVSRAVSRIDSFGVASIADPGIQEQVKAKYPDRKVVLPATVTKDSPVENLKGLRESLLSLRKGVSPGTGGLRPEFLITLAEVMDPTQMSLLEDFGMRYLSGDLPAWFYKVWLSVQSVPLFKDILQEAIRPIGIRNPLLKTYHREAISSSKPELIEFLEPQQIGMSEGGAARLVHGVRMLLEENPNFICVKNDVKNAFNESARSATVEALDSEPSLQHLAWHAAVTLAPNHGLESGGRLFGSAPEGQTQGDPEAAPWFCVGWHKYLRELDATLIEVGGMARAGMDDLYAVGPADVVFPALEKFWGEAGEHCGLSFQRKKTEIYSQDGERPDAAPEDLPMAGELLNHGFQPGFIVYGVPVGSDVYVHNMLIKKVKEIKDGAEKACNLLGGERQGLWTVLRASFKFQFEYWLSLVYPSQIQAAAEEVDGVLWNMLETVAGAHIPRGEEGLGWEECLDIPVRGLGGQSFQYWVANMPVRMGGMGLISQVDLSPIAFIGGLEQALPYFGGESGVCPPLQHLGAGGQQDQRWSPLLQSGCRTGRELARAWEIIQGEATEACGYLGKELEGPLSVGLEGLGAGSTKGATRKELSREREEMRKEVFERALTLHRDQRARGVSSWKERDKLTTAFLLSTPGPHSGLSSPVFAEAVATLLSMPSRVCVDRVGEKVGNSRVDLYGEAIISANLAGGHWTVRHNTVEQELSSLCSYAGLPAESEPYGLFAHLLPQQALHRLQQERRSQVLRPDLRIEVPALTVKVSAGAVTAAAAQVSAQFNGSMIAEIKVIGKGVRSYYKLGTSGMRAVDRRAAGIQQSYERKAANMDEAMGIQEEGPCLRRLREFPAVLDLCFGAWGEGSAGVHKMVSLLAACRVRTLGLQGKSPSPHQLGMETSIIRRRLSAAVVRANNELLLARVGQVGEGSSLAGKRRGFQRGEEHRMMLQREADWLVHTSGRELVRRGRFWNR